jgi:hypothetical protein
MKTQEVLIMTASEAKERIINWHIETFKNDPYLFVECMKDGTMSRCTGPYLNTLSFLEICHHLDGIDIAFDLAVNAGVKAVLLDKEDDHGVLIRIFDYDRLSDDEKSEFDLRASAVPEKSQR